MNLVYVILSYVVIGIGALFTFNHIGTLNAKISTQKVELENIKYERSLLIDTYNEEINDIRRSGEKRKTVIKEIIKNVETKNDPCINRNIPDDVFNRLRAYTEK